MNARLSVALLGSALAACSACGASEPTPDPVPGSDSVAEPSPPPEPVSYEVHEWGLVRGTLSDQVMLSGPHLAPIPMPMAKPVLYFHRRGEGPLSVDVDVRIANGRVVEHWPLGELDGERAHLTWRAVGVEEGDCAGSRYPTAAEPPCDTIQGPDACEATTLATVETREGACLRHGGAAFDHLFYRGEIRGAPSLPLTIAPAGTALRITHGGAAPIPGSIVRVQRSTRQVSVVPAPQPGSSIAIPAPSSPSQAGSDALAASLAAAGLTEAEVMAFRRAWDQELFGGEIAQAAGETIPPVAAASPMAGAMLPPSDDAILYVLPQATADDLAPLGFRPAPRVVRRAIVAWIDARLGAPARP